MPFTDTNSLARWRLLFVFVSSSTTAAVEEEEEEEEATSLAVAFVSH